MSGRKPRTLLFDDFSFDKLWFDAGQFGGLIVHIGRVCLINVIIANDCDRLNY